MHLRRETVHRSIERASLSLSPIARSRMRVFLVSEIVVRDRFPRMRIAGRGMFWIDVVGVRYWQSNVCFGVFFYVGFRFAVFSF